MSIAETPNASEKQSSSKHLTSFLSSGVIMELKNAPMFITK
jgi:hypothetical protein